MTRKLRSCVPVLAIVTLTACAPSEDPDPPPTEAERQRALRDSAFGPMVEPMDRARGVEQLQLDRTRELDEALERDQGR